MVQYALQNILGTVRGVSLTDYTNHRQYFRNRQRDSKVPTVNAVTKYMMHFRLFDRHLEVFRQVLHGVNILSVGHGCENAGYMHKGTGVSRLSLSWQVRSPPLTFTKVCLCMVRLSRLALRTGDRALVRLGSYRHLLSGDVVFIRASTAIRRHDVNLPLRSRI